MSTHTRIQSDDRPDGFYDFECELACEAEADEQSWRRRLMKSWVGSITAALPRETMAGLSAGRRASGHALAELQARIDELERENLELRAELMRRMQIEAALRRAKPGAKIAARIARAAMAPGHDLALASRTKRKPDASEGEPVAAPPEADFPPA